MKKKVVLKRLLVIFSISLLIASLIPSSYALTNPLLGLKFVYRYNGFGHAVTSGANYGAYGGVAVLYPDNTPTISSMTMTSGGGMHENTGLRSYSFIYRVTFSETVSSSAYPVFALAIEPALISSVDVRYQVNGVDAEWKKSQNILFDISGTGLFYGVDNGSLGVPYACTFEDITFLCFSMPVGVSADNIRVSVNFTYYPSSGGTTNQTDIAGRLMWPFEASQNAKAVLQSYAAITENDFLKPYLFGGFFLLLATMLGKFMM